MSDQNPFSAPAPDPSSPYAAGDQSGSSNPPPIAPGYIRQVPVLGVLMMIQGSLVMILGLFLAGMGILMPAILEQQMQQNPAFQQPPNVPGGDMETFMMVVYGGLGGLLFLVGLPTLISGVRIYKYRGRVMGIIALSAGLVTIMACYCFPTALGLFIFGLIVLMNDSVRKAFELGNQGLSSYEIKQRLLGSP